MQQLLRFLEAWKRWVPVLAVLLTAAGITIVVTDDDGDNRPDQIIINFPKSAPDPGAHFQVPAPVVADRDNELDPGEQAEARKSPADLSGNPDVHEDTRDEVPPGVTAEQVEEGAERTQELQREEPTRPQPVGGAQAYRCHSRPVVNQSALSYPQRGVALHFTVSNPGSLFAIRRLFNTPAFGASSNYGWDWAAPLGEYCHVWVPVGRKAWAQGAANSAYVSIEIHTNDRSRESWIANLRDGRLAALVRDLARRTGAPLKLVDPKGCVFPPGITDHDRLECGNSHWDVGSNFPWDSFMRQVKRGTNTAAAGKLLPGERRNVTCLQAERRSAKRNGGWGKIAPYHLRRASKCKAGLRRSIRFYRAHPKPNPEERSWRRARLQRVIRG